MLNKRFHKRLYNYCEFGSTAPLHLQVSRQTREAEAPVGSQVSGTGGLRAPGRARKAPVAPYPGELGAVSVWPMTTRAWGVRAVSRLWSSFNPGSRPCTRSLACLLWGLRAYRPPCQPLAPLASSPVGNSSLAEWEFLSGRDSLKPPS